MTKNSISGHLSILAVNVIFGLTVPFMKVLSDGWLEPVSLLAVRAFFAMLIFWLISFFVRKEKVSGRELWTILIGAQLGFVLSQYFTVLSLNYTSAVYTAIALACTPIISLLLGALFQHERITVQKLIGVVLALGGALLMILKGQSATAGANDVLGICLALLGGLSIAIYYIIMGGISERYSATTQMKWTFLFSGIALFPIGLYQFPSQAMYIGSPSTSVIGVLAFVILPPAFRNEEPPHHHRQHLHESPTRRCCHGRYLYEARSFFLRQTHFRSPRHPWSVSRYKGSPKTKNLITFEIQLRIIFNKRCIFAHIIMFTMENYKTNKREYVKPVGEIIYLAAGLLQKLSGNAGNIGAGEGAGDTRKEWLKEENEHSWGD